MKQKISRIVYAMLFIVSVGSLYAQSTSYNEYLMILVHQFSLGSSTGELRVYDASSMSGYPGPTSLTFLRDNRILIVDVWNERLSIFNDEFEIQEEIHTTNGRLVAGPFHYFADENVIIGTSMPDTWAGIDLEGDVFFRMSKTDSPLPNNYFRSYWYHNDVLFIHDRDNCLVSIREPSPVSEENRQRFLDTDQTRALFEAGSGWDPQGLSIDEQDRLFLDGELVTLDFRTFSDYWYEVHDGDMSKLSAFGRRIGGDTFIGKDNQGYTYWDAAHQFILVFSADGKLIEWFRYDFNKSSTPPTVSPEGHVYFMNSTQDTIDIYRVDRQW